MSQIEDQIKKDLVQAVKASDEVQKGVLRMAVAEFRNQQIDKKGALIDDEAVSVLRKMVKQREEAKESFREGGREEAMAKEEKEIEILKIYLPKQIDREEVKKKVETVVSEMGEVSAKDFGRVMGAVMKELKGKADGKMINEVVREVIKA